MKKAIYKVPNGKLVKISLDDSEGRVIEIKITGDFFMYPEENLASLEKSLVGVALDETPLREKIELFLRETQSTFYGLDAASLTTAILMAT